MLVELVIRNFAIIERVNLAFGPGLNVLTGETGAGKSILVDALGAVLGDRVNLDMVRTGAKSAAIDATFDLSQIPNRDEVTTLLEEFQVEVEDGVLILGREIQSGGRSSARLNGRPTTAALGSGWTIAKRSPDARIATTALVADTTSSCCTTGLRRPSCRATTATPAVAETVATAPRPMPATTAGRTPMSKEP